MRGHCSSVPFLLTLPLQTAQTQKHPRYHGMEMGEVGMGWNGGCFPSFYHRLSSAAALILQLAVCPFQLLLQCLCFQNAISPILFLSGNS